MRIYALILALFTISSFLYGEEYIQYVVQKSDTLSAIAKSKLGQPVYSKDGSLKKIIVLNPQLKNINRIYPGQVILLEKNESRSISSESDLPPTAEVPPMEDQERQKPNSFWVEPGLEYLQISSQDKINKGKSRFYSGLNPTLRLNLNLAWEGPWASDFELFAQNYEILEDQKTSPKKIKNSRGTRLAMSLGFLRSWGQTHRTGFRIGMEEKIFNHADGEAIEMDKVVTPVLHLNQEYDFYLEKKAKLGLGIQLKGFLPGRAKGYKTMLGYGLGTYLYADHRLRSVSVRGKLYYGREEQDSSWIEQNLNTYGASVGLSWDF